MDQWWMGLSALQKLFYFVAIPSSLILVIQFILSLVGFDSESDMDMDMDLDADVDVDLDVDLDMDMDADVDVDIDGYDPSVDFDADDISDQAGMMVDFKFVTFRGIIAFLTMFGWTGAGLAKTNMHVVLVILISTIVGLIAMFVIALMFYGISKLQSSGNISYKNAIGQRAEVYLTIPSKNNGYGKVQVLVQERLLEVNAATKGSEAISTGDWVRIVDVENGTTLIVEPVDK